MFNKFTNIDSFVTEYLDRTDLEPEDQHLDIVKRFALATIQKLVDSDDQMAHYVTILDLKNYSCTLPRHFNKLIEVAYHGHDGKSDKVKYRHKVVDWIADTAEGCKAIINIECPKCHEHKCCCGDETVKIEVDQDWLMGHPEFNFWHMRNYAGVRNYENVAESNYCPEFQLMVPHQHSFFNAQSHVRYCANFNKKLLAYDVPEYRIENTTIRVNREKGLVLLAFYGNYTDEDGALLIPDDTDTFEAIFWEVESKMLYRSMRRNRTLGNYYMNLYRIAEGKSVDSFRIAKNKLDAMSPDMWRTLVRNYFKKVPYNDNVRQAGRMMDDRINRF